MGRTYYTAIFALRATSKKWQLLLHIYSIQKNPQVNFPGVLLSRDRSFRCLYLNLRAEINQTQNSIILVFECLFCGTFHNMFQTWHTLYLWLHRYQRKKLPKALWGGFGKNHCREHLIGYYKHPCHQCQVFECHFSTEILTGEKTEKSLENLSLTTIGQMAELVERVIILGYYQDMVNTYRRYAHIFVLTRWMCSGNLASLKSGNLA